MFDCDIVRGYREIHANDPELSLISNRDLVLKLGLGFEKMGEGVLDKVGERSFVLSVLPVVADDSISGIPL